MSEGVSRMGDARDAFEESLRALVGEVDSWGEYREDTSPDERVAALWNASVAATAALAALGMQGGDPSEEQLVAYRHANEVAHMLWGEL